MPSKDKLTEQGHLIPGRPSIRLSERDEVAIGEDGLAIEYNGRSDGPHGQDASRRRSKFIIDLSPGISSKNG